MDLPSRKQLQLIPSLLTNPYDRILPLYSGLSVTICVGSSGHKYTLPKALVCKQSPYFSAMFQGGFKEGEDQTATLELVDGVVSVEAFEMLAQWLCIGRIVFKELAPEESITSAIELSRFADMCGITGVERQVAAHIRDIILANPLKKPPYKSRDPATNTHCITAEHIVAASYLPGGHAVRIILATASVEGYMQFKLHKFTEEAQCVAGFSADLLMAVKETLNTLHVDDYSGIFFREPISGDIVRLGREQPSPI